VSYAATESERVERTGLQWFVGDDGRWWTLNGFTSDHCPSIPEFTEYRRERAFALAPNRGTDAKTYEGLYDSAGNWKFQDCSIFELKVIDIVNEELFKNENEKEDRALARAAKRVGLSKKLAEAIHTKSLSPQCGWVGHPGAI
jgi:hypothetical protein